MEAVAASGTWRRERAAYPGIFNKNCSRPYGIVFATYGGGFYRGKAAVTRNAFGAGQVYYLGTVGDQALYNAIARQACEGAHVPFLADLPAGIEISRRTGESGTTRFVFNNTAKAQRFTLGDEELTLAPFEMHICREAD